MPHLNGGPVRDSSDDLASTSSRLERDVTSETGTQDEELDDGFGVPQRSGTCAARSVLAVVKYLLKRFGINRPDRKLIFYSFRLVRANAASSLSSHEFSDATIRRLIYSALKRRFLGILAFSQQLQITNAI